MRAAAALLALLLAAAGAGVAQDGAAQDDAAPDGAASAPDLWPEHAASDEETATTGRDALPFTTEQIRLLGALLQQARRATAEAAGAPPATTLRRLQIHPGQGEITTVRVARGYTTGVTFTDVTGEPWAIEEVLVDESFLPGRATTRPPGAQHILYLAPQRSHLHGNALVKLSDLTEPVVLTLAGGGPETDLRVDIRITQPGPAADAEALVQRPAFQAGDGRLLALLAGQPPEHATRLVVGGGDGIARAWASGDDILLVTASTVLSPGPWAAERAADGRWAYRLPATPFALIARDGTAHRIDFRSQPTTPLEADLP